MAIGQHVQKALAAKAEQQEMGGAAPEAPVTVPGLDPALMQVIAAVVAQSVAAAMQPMTDTLAAIVQGQGATMAASIKAARTKRPESYLGDFPDPNVSVFTPDGEPLPPLKCETFLGYYEEDEVTGQLNIIAGYPYLAEETGGCTLEERRQLDRIQRGVYRAKRRDQQEGIVRVQVRHDTAGQPFRKVIAVPKTWLTKQMKNMIGGMEFLRQLDPDVARRVSDPEASELAEAVA